MTINPTNVLLQRAHEAPDDIAAWFDGEPVSRSRLVERCGHAATYLDGMGVKRGDVVAWLLPNNAAFLECTLACAWIAAIGLPVNVRLASEEIGYILAHSRARLIIADQRYAPLLAGRFAENSAPQVVTSSGSASPWSEQAAVRGSCAPPPVSNVRPQDLMRLMYTSGTTSRPKGVMLTYGNLEAKNKAHAKALGLSAQDRGLVCGPLYHVGGLDLITTTFLDLGAPIYVQQGFDIGRILDAIDEYRMTVTWLAPTMIRRLLDTMPDPGRARSLRIIIGGGEAMPTKLSRELAERLPHLWFADAYGLTETISAETFLPKESGTKGSVGYACDGEQVAIHSDAGASAAPEIVGEVLLRGPKVCAGYWANPEATAEAFKDGWFHTGDIGWLDEKGCLHITGRKKDIIISGGENMSAAEIELVVEAYEGVSEAAAIGVPDEQWGEVPIVYFVAEAGKTVDITALRGHCASRLPSFKRPKGFFAIQSLPRNAIGKVLKGQLREIRAQGNASSSQTFTGD